MNGKKKIELLIVVSLLISCNENDIEKPLPGLPGNGNETEMVYYHARAKEMYDIVNQLFVISPSDNSSLYREDLGGTVYSYLWPYDVMVSGITALHMLGYSVNYETMVDNYEKYYHVNNGVRGYGSSTDGTIGGGTRFYDDNSIVGIELVKAYRITHQEKYMDRCGVIYEFLESGLDDIMGEALWWNEGQRNQPGVSDSNKPTCSNGFAANFLLNYHEICPIEKREEVLLFAKKLYSWLKENLQDPADKTYWNDRNASGNINQTKWTYNSGIMVMNGVMLYKITGEQHYLDEAKETASGAYNHFVKTRNGLPLAYPDHDPWFNTKLLEAFIAIEAYYPSAKNYIDTYAAFIENGYKKARTSNKLFYEDWTGVNQGRYTSLLMQAAVIESYGLLALYKDETYNSEK